MTSEIDNYSFSTWLWRIVALSEQVNITIWNIVLVMINAIQYNGIVFTMLVKYRVSHLECSQRRKNTVNNTMFASERNLCISKTPDQRLYNGFSDVKVKN